MQTLWKSGRRGIGYIRMFQLIDALLMEEEEGETDDEIDILKAAVPKEKEAQLIQYLPKEEKMGSLSIC